MLAGTDLVRRRKEAEGDRHELPALLAAVQPLVGGGLLADLLNNNKKRKKKTPQ